MIKIAEEIQRINKISNKIEKKLDVKRVLGGSYSTNKFKAIPIEEQVKLVRALSSEELVSYLTKKSNNLVKALFQREERELLTEDLAIELLSEPSFVKDLSQRISKAPKHLSRKQRIIRVVDALPRRRLTIDEKNKWDQLPPSEQKLLNPGKINIFKAGELADLYVLNHDIEENDIVELYKHLTDIRIASPDSKRYALVLVFRAVVQGKITINSTRQDVKDSYAYFLTEYIGIKKYIKSYLQSEADSNIRVSKIADFLFSYKSGALLDELNQTELVELAQMLTPATLASYLVRTGSNVIKTLFQDKLSGLLTQELADKMLQDTECVKLLMRHVQHFSGLGLLGQQSDISREFRIVRVIEHASSNLFPTVASTLAHEFTMEQMKQMFTSLVKDRWFKQRRNSDSINEADFDVFLSEPALIKFFRTLYDKTLTVQNFNSKGEYVHKFEDLINVQFLEKYDIKALIAKLNELKSTTSFSAKVAYVLFKQFLPELDKLENAVHVKRMLVNKLDSEFLPQLLSRNITNNALGELLVDLMYDNSDFLQDYPDGDKTHPAWIQVKHLKHLPKESQIKLAKKFMVNLSNDTELPETILGFLINRLNDDKDSEAMLIQFIENLDEDDDGLLKVITNFINKRHMSNDVMQAVLENPAIISVINDKQVFNLIKKLSAEEKLKFLEWYNDSVQPETRQPSRSLDGFSHTSLVELPGNYQATINKAIGCLLDEGFLSNFPSFIRRFRLPSELRLHALKNQAVIAAYTPEQRRALLEVLNVITSTEFAAYFEGLSYASPHKRHLKEAILAVAKNTSLTSPHIPDGIRSMLLQQPEYVAKADPKDLKVLFDRLSNKAKFLKVFKVTQELQPIIKVIEAYYEKRRSIKARQYTALLDNNDLFAALSYGTQLHVLRKMKSEDFIAFLRTKYSRFNGDITQRIHSAVVTIIKENLKKGNDDLALVLLEQKNLLEYLGADTVFNAIKKLDSKLKAMEIRHRLQKMPRYKLSDKIDSRFNNAVIDWLTKNTTKAYEKLYGAKSHKVNFSNARSLFKTLVFASPKVFASKLSPKQWRDLLSCTSLKQRCELFSIIKGHKNNLRNEVINCGRDEVLTNGASKDAHFIFGTLKEANPERIQAIVKLRNQHSGYRTAIINEVSESNFIKMIKAHYAAAATADVFARFNRATMAQTYKSLPSQQREKFARVCFSELTSHEHVQQNELNNFARMWAMDNSTTLQDIVKVLADIAKNSENASNSNAIVTHLRLALVHKLKSSDQDGLKLITDNIGQLFPESVIKAMYNEAQSSTECRKVVNMFTGPLSGLLNRAQKRLIKNMDRDLNHGTSCFTEKYSGRFKSWGMNVLMNNSENIIGRIFSSLIKHAKNTYQPKAGNEDLIELDETSINSELQEVENESFASSAARAVQALGGSDQLRDVDTSKSNAPQSSPAYTVHYAALALTTRNETVIEQNHSSSMSYTACTL